MSGIEVAGLALAIFPVSIWLLETIQQSYGLYKDWRKVHAKFSRIYADLKLERRNFENITRLFLGDLDLSDEDIEMLMANPEEPAWRQSQLREKFERRLQDSHQMFGSILEGIRDSIQDFEDKLGISERIRAELLQERSANRTKTFARLRQSKTLFLNYEWNKVKLVLSQSRLRDIVLDIRRRNQDLWQLRSTSVELYNQIQRRSYRNTKPLQQLRKHADSLYNFFLREWPCSCRPSHENASVFLKHEFEAEETELRDSKSVFEIALLTVRSANGVSTARQGPLYCTLQAIEQARQDISTVRHEVKRAKFESPKPATTIDDNGSLCIILNKYSKNVNHVGSFVEGQNRITIALSPPRVEPLSADLNILNLADLMSSSENQTLPTGSKKLTQQHRILLAANIAYAFFILFKTPWFSSDWGLQKFAIIEIGENRSNISLIEHHFPQRGKGYVENLDPKVAFLKLAICLEELCFGERLEKQQIYSEFCNPLGQPYQFTAQMAAMKWFDDVQGQLGEYYSSSVKQCLIYVWTATDENCSMPNFWQEAHDSIVEPLQRTAQLWGH